MQRTNERFPPSAADERAFLSAPDPPERLDYDSSDAEGAGTADRASGDEDAAMARIAAPGAIHHRPGLELTVAVHHGPGNAAMANMAVAAIEAIRAAPLVVAMATTAQGIAATR